MLFRSSRNLLPEKTDDPKKGCEGDYSAKDINEYLKVSTAFCEHILKTDCIAKN